MQPCLTSPLNGQDAECSLHYCFRIQWGVIFFRVDQAIPVPSGPTSLLGVRSALSEVPVNTGELAGSHVAKKRRGQCPLTNWRHYSSWEDMALLIIISNVVVAA